MYVCNIYISKSQKNVIMMNKIKIYINKRNTNKI